MENTLNTTPITEIDESNQPVEEEVEWEVGEEDIKDAKISLMIMIIGKLWTRRNVNPNALMATIKNVRHPHHGLEAKSLGHNKFSFQFFHWRDKKHILHKQPWHFERHALCLCEIEGDALSSEVNPHHIPMWVRLYDLPFKGRSNIANAKTLCNKIGKFISMEDETDNSLNKFLRVRLEIDVEKPLKDTINIKVRGGTSKTIMVKYKKMPLVCFICGMLGHGDKDCPEHDVVVHG